MGKPDAATLGLVLLLLPVAAATPAGAQESARCALTAEQAIPDIDDVLAESPRQLTRYRHVLWKHFPYQMPYQAPNRPDQAMTGCDVKLLTEIGKRSRFFHEVRCGPQLCSIEFRGSLAKMYLTIDRSSQTLTHANAWWIKPSL